MDEQQQRKQARRNAALESRQLREDVKTLLEVPAFRRYALSLLEFCGEYRISYVNGDPESTVFNEGMRNVAQKIKADMADVTPLAYPKMLIEYATPASTQPEVENDGSE